MTGPIRKIIVALAVLPFLADPAFANQGGGSGGGGVGGFKLAADAKPEWVKSWSRDVEEMWAVYVWLGGDLSPAQFAEYQWVFQLGAMTEETKQLLADERYEREWAEQMEDLDQWMDEIEEWEDSIMRELTPIVVIATGEPYPTVEEQPVGVVQLPALLAAR